MKKIFNRYSNQLASLYKKTRILLVYIFLVVCFAPVFVFSQSLPVVDNSNDLLGLSPLSINNYVQCTIKYLQNSSSLIKVVQEKNNRISFYQKSLKELIEIYNKLYNADQLTEAQELIQEIQKIRIFSSRLSKSLEVGISLNKQIIKETQKKTCYINNLQAIEISQVNMIAQSNSLEDQLSINLEKAYKLINQTQFKKSQQLISNLNSSSSREAKSESSSSASVNSSEILSSSSSSSSVYSLDLSDSKLTPITPIPNIPKSIPPKSNSSQSASNSADASSVGSLETISSSSISSVTSSSNPSSLINSSVSSTSSLGVSSSSQNSSAPKSDSQSSSSLIPDEDLGNLANDQSSSRPNNSARN